MKIRGGFRIHYYLILRFFFAIILQRCYNTYFLQQNVLERDKKGQPVVKIRDNRKTKRCNIGQVERKHECLMIYKKIEVETKRVAYKIGNVRIRQVGSIMRFPVRTVSQKLYEFKRFARRRGALKFTFPRIKIMAIPTSSSETPIYTNPGKLCPTGTKNTEKTGD